MWIRVWSRAGKNLAAVRTEANSGSVRELLLVEEPACSHSCILTPPQGAFASIRDQILDKNLDAGCQNHFTTFDRSWCVDGEAPRYLLESIEYKHPDVAVQGDWSIERDLRWSLNRSHRTSMTMGF